MSTQNTETATDMRMRLRERATELRSEIRSTLMRSDEESHVRIAELARDIEDDSFADLIVDLNHAEVSRDLGELREIDGAMQRLADGTYGICADCDKTIAADRLRVQPTAQRCIACQETFEKTHFTSHGPSL